MNLIFERQFLFPIKTQSEIFFYSHFLKKSLNFESKFTLMIQYKFVGK